MADPTEPALEPASPKGSTASSPRSPEPSRPLYEHVGESQSQRAYSTASKSRTALPPDTPIEERRDLERLKQAIVFDEAEKDLEGEEEGKGDETVEAAAPQVEETNEEATDQKGPAPLVIDRSPDLVQEKEEEEEEEEEEEDQSVSAEDKQKKVGPCSPKFYLFIYLFIYFVVIFS